jgi:periplasmic divalent cation tolerance protein
MRLNLIYITAKNKEEAEKIGKELVESRLAACVNIIDNIHSWYQWEGKIQEDDEAILIAKTKESLMPEFIEKVKSMHSYECPCIVSLPLLDGNQDYLAWVQKETK